MKSRCFKPVARADARVLILGSLPGTVSLQRNEYYAQQHNAFWRIMGEVTGASGELPYQHRLRLLTEKGIALWDVCAAGYRLGSLDSAIQLPTVETNDIAGLLSAQPSIDVICFNGRKAKEIYDRKVRQEPAALFERIRCAVLPSTSPAHAAMPYQQKLEQWRRVLDEARASQMPRRSSPLPPAVERKTHPASLGATYENDSAVSRQTQAAFRRQS